MDELRPLTSNPLASRALPDTADPIPDSSLLEHIDDEEITEALTRPPSPTTASDDSSKAIALRDLNRRQRELEIAFSSMPEVITLATMDDEKNATLIAQGSFNDIYEFDNGSIKSIIRLPNNKREKVPSVDRENHGYELFYHLLDREIAEYSEPEVTKYFTLYMQIPSSFGWIVEWSLPVIVEDVSTKSLRLNHNLVKKTGVFASFSGAGIHILEFYRRHSIFMGDIKDENFVFLIQPDETILFKVCDYFGMRRLATESKQDEHDSNEKTSIDQCREPRTDIVHSQQVCHCVTPDNLPPELEYIPRMILIELGTQGLKALDAYLMIRAIFNVLAESMELVLAMDGETSGERQHRVSLLNDFVRINFIKYSPPIREIIGLLQRPLIAIPPMLQIAEIASPLIRVMENDPSSLATYLYQRARHRYHQSNPPTDRERHQLLLKLGHEEHPMGEFSLSTEEEDEYTTIGGIRLFLVNNPELQELIAHLPDTIVNIIMREPTDSTATTISSQPDGEEKNHSIPTTLEQIEAMTQIRESGKFGEVRLCNDGYAYKLRKKLSDPQSRKKIEQSFLHEIHVLRYLQNFDFGCDERDYLVIGLPIHVEGITVIKMLALGSIYYNEGYNSSFLQNFIDDPRLITTNLFDRMLMITEVLRRARILHRDIKPNNFLFDIGGNIKLTDFGASAVLYSTPFSIADIDPGNKNFSPVIYMGSERFTSSDNVLLINNFQIVITTIMILREILKRYDSASDSTTEVYQTLNLLLALDDHPPDPSFTTTIPDTLAPPLSVLLNTTDWLGMPYHEDGNSEPIRSLLFTFMNLALEDTKNALFLHDDGAIAMINFLTLSLVQMLNYDQEAKITLCDFSLEAFPYVQEPTVTSPLAPVSAAAELSPSSRSDSLQTQAGSPTEAHCAESPPPCPQYEHWTIRLAKDDGTNTIAIINTENAQNDIKELLMASLFEPRRPSPSTTKAIPAFSR